MNLQDLLTATKISIAGYGVEGKAAEQFCKTQCPSVPLEIVDPINASVSDDGGVWIVSPGIPRTYFQNIPAERVTSGTEIFLDSLTDAERLRVIGISGTKGKSTTTKFCTEAFITAGKKAVAAGNFGVPLLEVFEDFQNEVYEYVVAELSSYQLENLQTSPGFSIFLNLFPDHLDRHGSVANYSAAKANLWNHQQKGDYLFVPAEIEMSFDTKSKVYKTESLSPELFPEDSAFRADHWLQNLGTVDVLFQILQISKQAIEQTAQEFVGLPHRLQQFSTAHKRTWWDDAICTNPEAAIATVKFFGDRLGAIILGGQDRGMDYSGLAEILSKTKAQVLILKSELSSPLQSLLPQAIEVASFDEAVTHILAHTPEGSDVVLCPAAPSYDAFKNFQEKGAAFQEAVAGATA